MYVLSNIKGFKNIEYENKIPITYQNIEVYVKVYEVVISKLYIQRN